MPRKDSENVKYLCVAVFITAVGVLLLGVGIWYYVQPESTWEGYTGIVGGLVVLMVGIPLLFSGLARFTDERRSQKWDEKYGRRRRGGVRR